MSNSINSIKTSVDANEIPKTAYNNPNRDYIIVISDNSSAYKPNNNKTQTKTDKDYIVLTPIDGSEPKIIINEKSNNTNNNLYNKDSHIIKIEDKIDGNLLNLSNVSSNNMEQLKSDLSYKINGETVILIKDGNIVGYTSLDELKRIFNTDKVEEVNNIDTSGSFNGSNLNLSKIAVTASDANNGNFVDQNKLQKNMFSKDIFYNVRDDGTVLLSKDGVALGFTTVEALEESLNGKVSNESIKNDNNLHISNKNSEKPTKLTNNIEDNIVNVDKELEAKADAIENNNSISSDFNFRHNESNILAAKAKNMGFTDDQIKIAIGISRWETGNYKHLAGGYNYGGVTGVGDAGHYNQYANYSTPDVGMNAYLKNLKNNYFDKGLNSVETIARKYLGYDDTASWINGVKGCMK